MAEMRDFRLPDLGEGLTEAELVRWLVGVGDRVEADQAIAEVTTEKAEVQVPTPFAGVVRTLHAQPGETLAVGRPLVTVEVEVEAGAEGLAEGKVETPAGREVKAEAETPAGRAVATETEVEALAAAPGLGDEGGSGRILVGYGTRAGAEPRRRRVTATDLARHLGGGDGERLTRPAARGEGLTRPATRAGAAGPALDAPGAPRRLALTSQRRAAAERLSRAHAEIPAATAWVAADASRLLELRDLINSRQGQVRVTPLAVLLRLTVAALQRHPMLNATYDPERGEAVLASAVHLGVATQTERGLVVPVIRDAQRLAVAAIAAELERLASSAREGRIGAAELRGSTFTVSNFGGLGVDSGIALINPPEAAVLGCGRIAPRPWVDGEAVVVRPVIELSLSFDHRICDGADAASFLRLLGDLVESPALALAGA